MELWDLSPDLLPSGATPLHLAANNDDTTALNSVLETDQSDLNTPDSHGRTPLVVALRNGRLNAAVVLIQNGARLDVCYEPPGGLLVSDMLSRPVFSRLVDSLIEADVSLSFVPNSMLPTAAYEGKTNTVRKLVSQYGVNVDHADNLRRTALHYASLRGDGETVSCLVQLGASHTVTDLSSSTPLHLACAAGHQDMVQFLLEGSGVSALNCVDACERTPAHIALYNKHFSVFLYLLTNFKDSLNLEQVDKHGHTLGSLLFFFRCRLNALPSSLHCSLPCLSKEEASWLLFDAVSRQDSQLVSFSLSQGASVSHWDYLQQTPLLLASKLGSVEICQTLVKHEADPNVVDPGGKTPLQYAAEHDHLSVFEFLLPLSFSPAKVRYTEPLSPGLLSILNSYEESPETYNWQRLLSLAAPHASREEFRTLSEAICPPNWLSILASNSRCNEEDVHASSESRPTLPVYDSSLLRFKTLHHKHGRKPPSRTEKPFSFTRRPQNFYPLHEAAIHGNADVFSFILSQAEDQSSLNDLLLVRDDQGRTALSLAARSHSLLAVMEQFYLTTFVESKLEEEHPLPEGVTFEVALLHFLFNGGGCNPRVSTRHPQTPLARWPLWYLQHRVAEYCHKLRMDPIGVEVEEEQKQLAKLVLEHSRPTVDGRVDTYPCLLYVAVKSNCFWGVQLLLSYGAQPTAQHRDRFALVEAAQRLQVEILNLFFLNGFSSSAHSPELTQLSLSIVQALVTLVNSGYIQSVERLCEVLPVMEHLWSTRNGVRLLYVSLATGALNLGRSILRSFLEFLCRIIASWSTVEPTVQSEFSARLEELQRYLSFFSSFPDPQVKQLAQLISFYSSHALDNPTLFFHKLCGHGCCESVELLLENGGACLVNVLDDAGHMPLFFAACGGHLSIVKNLLAKSASVYPDASTPPIIGLLLYFALAPRRHAPRRFFTGYGPGESVKVESLRRKLFSHIERTIPEGFLYYSLLYQDPTASQELVQLLLPPSHSTNWFKSQFSDERTPGVHPLLLVASIPAIGPHIGIVLEAILSEVGTGSHFHCELSSEIAASTSLWLQDCTLLDSALILAPNQHGSGNTELLEPLLIEYAPESRLHKPLLAAQKGYWKLLEASCKYNTAVETCSLETLKLAAKQGKTEVVLALLPNDTSESNRPLELAVKGNHLDVVSGLLDRTTDPLSALEVAARYNRKEAFDLLLSSLSDRTETLSRCIDKLIHLAVLSHSTDVIGVLLTLYQDTELVIGSDFAERNFCFWFQVLVSATKGGHEDLALQALACIPESEIKELTAHRKYKDILYWTCYWGMADLLDCIPFTVEELFERHDSSPWECAVANGHLGKLSFVKNFPSVPENLTTWLEGSPLNLSDEEDGFTNVTLDFYNTLTIGSFHKLCSSEPSSAAAERREFSFSFFESQFLLKNVVGAGSPHAVQVLLEHLGRSAGHILKLFLEAHIPILHIACSNGGNHGVLEPLLKALFEASVLDEVISSNSYKGYLVLPWAVKNRAEECVEALLRCSPSSLLRFEHSLTGNGLLHLAVLSGKPRVVDMILKSFDTEAPDACFVPNKNNEYPLYLAFALGHYETAALLIKVAKQSTQWEHCYHDTTPGSPKWRSTAKQAKGWFRALNEQAPSSTTANTEMNMRAPRNPQSLLVYSVKTSHNAVVKALLTASCGYIIDQQVLLRNEEILLNADVLKVIAADENLLSALRDYDATSLVCKGIRSGKSKEVVLLLKSFNSSRISYTVDIEEVLLEACVYNQFELVQLFLASHAIPPNSTKKALEVCTFGSGGFELAAYIQLHTGVKLDEHLPPGFGLSPVVQSVFLDDTSYYSLLEQLFQSVSGPGALEERHPFSVAWLSHRWGPQQCQLLEDKVGKAPAPTNPWVLTIEDGEERHTMSVSIDWESFSEVLLGTEGESPTPFPLFVESIVFSPSVLGCFTSANNPQCLAGWFGLDSAEDGLPSSFILTCVCWPDGPSGSSSSDGHGLIVLSYSPEERSFLFPSSALMDTSQIEDSSRVPVTTTPFSSLIPQHFRNLATYIGKSATRESGGRYCISVELSQDFSEMSDSESFRAVYPALRRMLYDVCEVLKLTVNPAVLYSHLGSDSSTQTFASLSKPEAVFCSALVRVSLEEDERKDSVNVSISGSTLEVDLNIVPPDGYRDEPPTIPSYEDTLRKFSDCLLAAELEVMKEKLTQMMDKEVVPKLQKALKTSLIQADSSSILLQDKLGDMHSFSELTEQHLVSLKSFAQFRRFLFLVSRMLGVLKYKPRLQSSARSLFEMGFTAVVSNSASTGFSLKAGVPQLTFNPADVMSSNFERNILEIFPTIIQTLSPLHRDRQSLDSFITGLPAPFVCRVNLERSKGLLFPSLKSQGVITIDLLSYSGQILNEFPNTNCVLQVVIKTPSAKTLSASSSDDPSPRSASRNLLVRAQSSGVFVIEWTPTDKGLHHLSIAINGINIQGSPFKSFVPEAQEEKMAVNSKLEFGPDHWAWSKGSNGSRRATAGTSLVFIASHPQCGCSHALPPPPVVLRNKKPIQPLKRAASTDGDVADSPHQPKASPRPLTSAIAESASYPSPQPPLATVTLEERVHHISVCSGSGISNRSWIHIPTGPLVVLVSKDSRVTSEAKDKRSGKKSRNLQHVFKAHSLSLRNGLYRVSMVSTLAGTIKVFAACSVCQAVMHVQWDDQTALLPQSVYILPGPFCPGNSRVTARLPSESGRRRHKDTGNFLGIFTVGNLLGTFTAGSTVRLYMKAKDQYGNAHTSGGAIRSAVIEGAGKREFENPDLSLQDIVALQSHSTPAQCTVEHTGNGVYEFSCDVYTAGTHKVRIVDHYGTRRSIGTIRVEGGEPSARHSRLDPGNNYRAVRSEKFTIHVHVYDTFFNPVSKLSSRQIQADIGMQSFSVLQSLEGPNTYALFLTPNSHGKKELCVRIGGELVPSCPLEINIVPLMESFSKKLRRLREYLFRTHRALRSYIPTITIDRENLLESAVTQLHEQYFYQTIRVRFGDEPGIDTGGVSREFFHLLCKEFINPQYALFQCVGGLYRPSTQSSVNPNHLFYFSFFGKVLAKTVCDGHQTNVRFTPAVYKYLLQHECVLDDLKIEDPSLHQGLLEIVNAENQEALEQLAVNFTTNWSNFGAVETVELERGGEQRSVTMENREEFLNKLFTWHLTGCIQEQLESLKRGFQSIIPSPQLANFTSHELEVVLSGQPTIDLQFLKSRTTISGFPLQHKSQIVQWLWEVLESFSQEQRCQFLQFTTGCACLPTADMGQWEFHVKRGSDDPSLLPLAATCFNSITIPDYPSREVLRQKLELAISCGSQAFLLH